ncbi:MAG: hypothetical protein JWN48_2579 [Myxococcaceae bacterium]|nr:hypothetical protein [Myxococcaceae bacterium]
MLLIAHSSARLCTSLAGVSGPSGHSLCWTASSALLLCLLAGCLEETRYVVSDASVTMTPELAPAFVTEDEDPVFRIDGVFPLRVTPPKAAELDKLGARAQGMMLPFPRLPYLALHDLELQLDYALSNQSDRALVATVTVNGINEFVYYAPGPEQSHQWQRRIALTPGQRVTGTVTDVELDEVAVDLATVVNGAPNSNLVVDFQSQSGRDVRVQPFIPRVIPGLDGVRAGIESMGDGEGAKAPALTLELTLRVQDLNDKACKRGQKPWVLPEAAPFTPIVPEEM